MLRLYVETSVLSAAARGHFPAEVAAYDEIKALVRSGAVALYSSPVTLEEFGAIPAPHVGPHRVQYDAVGTVQAPETYEEFNPATACLDLEENDPTLEALRVIVRYHENDARHLAQAANTGMNVFLTTDEDDILKRADAIRVQAGLRVFKPSEFLAWFRSRENGGA